MRRPPTHTLFPYTTLFRSLLDALGLSNLVRAAVSWPADADPANQVRGDRKSTRLNSSHRCISYAVFCLKKKKNTKEKGVKIENIKDAHEEKGIRCTHQIGI